MHFPVYNVISASFAQFLPNAALRRAAGDCRWMEEPFDLTQAVFKTRDRRTERTPWVMTSARLSITQTRQRSKDAREKYQPINNVCTIQNENILSEYARERVSCVTVRVFSGDGINHGAKGVFNHMGAIWDWRPTIITADTHQHGSVTVSPPHHRSQGHTEGDKQSKKEKCYAARCLTTDIKSCLHILGKTWLTWPRTNWCDVPKIRPKRRFESWKQIFWESGW